MERCAYCGGPVDEDDRIELHDEVFCSEDCMEEFDAGDNEEYYDDDDEYDDDDDGEEDDDDDDDDDDY